MFLLNGRSRTTDRPRNPPCWLVALVFGAALLGAPFAVAQTPTAKLAIVSSATGAFEVYGRPFLDGIRLAVEEANEAGMGPRIELDTYDDRSSDEGAREVARQITASDALAVVGPMLTASSLVQGPIFAGAGIASIVSAANGDGVTDSATTFRAVFSTTEMGESLANYLRYALDGTRAIVISRDNGFGRPMAEGFKRAADRLGIATAMFAFTSAAERERVAALAAADPEKPAIILGMLNDDATPVLVALRRLGVRAPILGPSALGVEPFANAFADLPEERQARGFFTNGLYTASPVMLDSASAETLAFSQRSRVRSGREGSWVSVQGYDATRLAIAALRAASLSGGASDLRARRAAALAYLLSLDNPSNAVAGLTGPLWFRSDRGREMAIRVGRFYNGLFESAPLQLVPVSNPDPAEIAAGTLVDIGSGHFARRQQVIYTGVYLNEIASVDAAHSMFTADFYVWERFARGIEIAGADPTEIEFPDLVRGTFDGGRPALQRDLDDGTTYRLWHMRGDFKNDFDLHYFPADRQTLVVRFFNARAASDRLVYVLDRRSLDSTAGEVPVDAGKPGSVVGGGPAAETAQAPFGIRPADAFASAVAPAAFRNLTQWEAVRTGQRRDSLITESALGDPGLVGLERVRELSGFEVTIELRRRVIATLAKTLLPLGLMSLIMFASLYFPADLVKEKVTVATAGGLSGAVLLSSINSQFGNVGYVIAIEYGFYVYFILCLLCIVVVLAAERLRVAERPSAANTVEQSGRYLFMLGLAGTVAAVWFVAARW